jgi:hypothetical protein
MAEKHPKIEDEPGTQERFDRAIKTALATPPRPHKWAKPNTPAK